MVHGVEGGAGLDARPRQGVEHLGLLVEVASVRLGAVEGVVGVEGDQTGADLGEVPLQRRLEAGRGDRGDVERRLERDGSEIDTERVGHPL